MGEQSKIKNLTPNPLNLAKAQRKWTLSSCIVSRTLPTTYRREPGAAGKAIPESKGRGRRQRSTLLEEYEDVEAYAMGWAYQAVTVIWSGVWDGLSEEA
ncbi:hypothetical protein Tdes44962_MAKER05941 [Teratosphaeria destructans]|uniref:Uncharacterized protein n=1 Tax=Teratosphaeria destructans TaxID=418781 RepID=A0A9W7SIS0_9PEZI|nr:hypothetical protein Tdes44962_MAKER05941 [Teratosphaeria destructans]